MRPVVTALVSDACYMKSVCPVKDFPRVNMKWPHHRCFSSFCLKDVENMVSERTKPMLHWKSVLDSVVGFAKDCLGTGNSLLSF